MFLKCTRRNKDGKTHHYWSVVESRRLSTGRITQRQVLYLGEINDSQKAAWRKSIDVFDEGRLRQVALFPEALAPPGDAMAVGIRLNEPCLSGWLPIKFFGESICRCTAFRTWEPLRWQPTQELS